MSSLAKITVVAGPDRGKSCELADEIARLGRGTDNTLVLTDPDLTDQLVSIMQRDGRFAIIANGPSGLEIDGTAVPAERWVWLPEQAQIRVSRRTELEFSMRAGQNGSAPPQPTAVAAESAPRRPGSSSTEIPRAPTKTRRSAPSGEGSSDAVSPRKRGEKKARTVARFVTDGPGDPLVKLGEDGHLPELTLAEGPAREAGGEATARQTSPLLLTLVVLVSLGLTVALLLMDAGTFGTNTAQKASARREIVEYYGGEREPLPWQVHLRQARQAHSRGDMAAERQEYRQVLDLLRSEGKDKLRRYTGLTGQLDYDRHSANRKSDRRLEELIGILLSE